MGRLQIAQFDVAPVVTLYVAVAVIVAVIVAVNVAVIVAHQNAANAKVKCLKM